MSGAPLLGNALVPSLAAIRSQSQNQLHTYLHNVNGPHCHVYDPVLMRPLGLVFEARVLMKEFNTQAFYVLGDDLSDIEDTHVVFLVRPTVTNAQNIATLIQTHQASGLTKTYTALCVSRATEEFKHTLKHGGIYGDVSCYGLDIPLVPLENDVFSAISPGSFRAASVEKDAHCAFAAASAIHALELRSSAIPTITVKGDAAEQVAQLLKRRRAEREADVGAGNSSGGREGKVEEDPDIARAIIIDRAIDLPSALLTQLTYEGLISEFLGVQWGSTEIPYKVHFPKPKTATTEELAKRPPEDMKVECRLNSNDPFYEELRDAHISALGVHISRKARELEAFRKKKNTLTDLSEMRGFVEELRNVRQREEKAVRIHMHLGERIMLATGDVTFKRRLYCEQMASQGGFDEALQVIKDAITRGDPLTQVLRAISVLSTTQAGFKEKHYNAVRSSLVNAYGFKMAGALDNMWAAGLFYIRRSGKGYPYAAKAMKLHSDLEDLENPDDMSYVFSGYSPLSVRLVQQFFTDGGWAAQKAALEALPGPQRTHYAPMTPGATTFSPGAGGAPKSGGLRVVKDDVTLVFFVGGVTFAEIAALRFLSNSLVTADGRPRRFLIGTTEMVTGDSIVDSMVDDLPRYSH